jgi:hypothetical protein
VSMRRHEAEDEDRLLCIWRDVLEVAEVSRDANFFELSGNSLQAVDLACRVSFEFGRDVTVMDILDFPTFVEFVGRVQEAPELPPPPGAGTGGPGPAGKSLRRPSMLQEDSLRLDATGPSDHFLIRFGYLIQGALDVSRLSRAVELLAWRHELLRTAVGWRDGEAFLEILEGSALQLRIIDAPCPAGVATADHVRSVALQHPDLTPTRSEPPLARLTLLRMGSELHALVVALDHIICDGFSIKLLVADISETYGVLSVRPDFRPDDVPISFSRWASEQRLRLCGEHLARLVGHWRTVLGDDPGILSPPLPWSDLRPGGALTCTRDFDDQVRRKFTAAAHRQGMSLFSVGIAALGTCLAEVVGPERTCLTTTWVNRSLPAHMQVFGPLAHDIYIRLGIDPALPADQRLGLARAAIHNALEHDEVPGLVLYRELWPTSTSDPTLQPTVYVTVNERWPSGLRLDGTEIQEIPIDGSNSGRDLTCEFTVENGGISRIDMSTSSSGITPDFMAALISSIEDNVA